MAAVALLLLGALACAPYQRQIIRRGVADEGQEESFLTPGVSVCVVRNPDADSGALHEKSAQKIERLLANGGFSLSRASEADLLVFFGYGTMQLSSGRITSASSRGGTPETPAPTRSKSRTSAFDYIEEGGFDLTPMSSPGVAPRNKRGGPSVDGERFGHYFVTVVIDGRFLRLGQAVKTVWRGESQLESQLTKNPKQPEVLLDRLLVAAFAKFGQSEDWTRWQEDTDD
jgi:hypothetical protein